MSTSPKPVPVPDPKPPAIKDPRCWRCDRILAAVLTPPFSLRCSRCKATNSHPA